MGTYRQEEGGQFRLERVPARLLEGVLRGGQAEVGECGGKTAVLFASVFAIGS